MPAESTESLTVSCDNPNCPGNTLPADSRTGWLFVTSEVYAEGPTTQHVYCCTDCVSADAAALDVRNPQPA